MLSKRKISWSLALAYCCGSIPNRCVQVDTTCFFLLLRIHACAKNSPRLRPRRAKLDQLELGPTLSTKWVWDPSSESILEMCRFIIIIIIKFSHEWMKYEVLLTGLLLRHHCWVVAGIIQNWSLFLQRLCARRRSSVWKLFARRSSVWSITKCQVFWIHQAKNLLVILFG